MRLTSEQICDLHAPGSMLNSVEKNLLDTIDAMQADVDKLVAEASLDGLTVSIKSDGTWLNFDAGKGKRKASIRLESMVEERGHVIGGAISDWIEALRSPAKDAQ